MAHSLAYLMQALAGIQHSARQSLWVGRCLPSLWLAGSKQRQAKLHRAVVLAGAVGQLAAAGSVVLAALAHLAALVAAAAVAGVVRLVGVTGQTVDGAAALAGQQVAVDLKRATVAALVSAAVVAGAVVMLLAQTQAAAAVAHKAQ